MPTYEYQCPQGHHFERFQKMSDPPEADCPECGEAGERLLSGGAGFLFKGEGFYITDYRSEDYKKKARTEAGEGEGARKEGDKAPLKDSSPGGTPASGPGDAGSKAPGGGSDTGSPGSAGSGSSS